MKHLLLVMSMIFCFKSFAIERDSVMSYALPFIDTEYAQKNLKFYYNKTRRAQGILNSKMSHQGKRKAIIHMIDQVRNFANMNSMLGSMTLGYIRDIENLVRQYKYGEANQMIGEISSYLKEFIYE